MSGPRPRLCPAELGGNTNVPSTPKRLLLALSLALALLVAPITGCQPSTVRVQLPLFRSGEVDGIWLWRLGAAGYERVCRFDLSDAYLSGGREVVTYLQTCLDGRPASAQWQATVERLPSDPSTVTLVLLHQPFGAVATHRASAFNGAGESALSTSTLAL